MKIAIVKLSALGDIVHAMIVLQYIKNYNSNITIDWFVEEKFSSILEHNPHINSIYKLKIKDNKMGLYKEYLKLKKLGSYDLVIDLQGLIKSALVSRVLGKNIAGFDKNSLRERLASVFYTKTFSIPYEENVINRNMLLVCKTLGFDMPNLQHKEPFLFTKNSLDFRQTLLIIVGSSWKSKIYPKEHFIEIINSLQVPTAISWGDELEREDAEFIRKKTDAKLLLKLTLGELKNVISNSDLVIGADSGPTHMAWALNRPSITIFGPTPSHRNTFVTDINLTIDCKKHIDAKSLNKDDFCIKNIKPEDIVTLAKRLLNAR